MRAIRRFTVSPVLPSALTALSRLAGNLRWSWHPPTQDLFASIDPQLWDSSGHDPVRMLGLVPKARLAELAADPVFLERLQAVAASLDAYVGGNRWYQSLRDGAEEAGAVPERSPTSRRSSASQRFSRSTAAVSGSSRVTT